MANYCCEHCGKKFEAPEAIVQRCPSCFWTTSVHLINEPGAQPSTSTKQNIKPPSVKFALPEFSPKIFKILIGLVITALILFALKGALYRKTDRAADISKKDSSVKVDDKTETATRDAAKPSLTEEESKILAREVKLEIPRPFSQDELEILNRHVDFSFEAEKVVTSKFWSQNDFEAFLAKQQKTKGIYFSWSYERKLVKLFKEHYSVAGEAVAANDFGKARLELIQALVFPIYSDNLLTHKAVALVMLQPYINDILAKLSKLNMHLLMSRIQSSIQPIQAKYETLFNMIKDQDIDEAFQTVELLETNVESINQSAKQAQVEYPPTVAQIDSDIRRGIDLQDEALEPISTGLNSVVTDLRLKKNILSQNLPASMRATEENYQNALRAIKSQNWQEALSALGKVQFPPELADDARQKEAVIRKVASN